MRSVKFAVIIPTYNRPKLLLNAVRAVFEQTFKDWVLIVVNDASDANYAELEDLLVDDRLHYIVRESNGGCNSARNTGIDEAVRLGADYVVFSDDEEELDPRCLEVAADTIQ